MGVTRQDFIRSGRYLQMPDAEWEAELATRKEVVGNYMANDEWATKIYKKVGIHLTCSPYSLPFLKASVESFKKLGYWIVLSYDNFINPKDTSSNIDWGRWMPPKDVMDSIDTFLIPHYQSWGGVSYGYSWQLKLCSSLLSNFEYVLCANGDCVIEKPEGFSELLEMLGDADIMSSGPSLPREIGTAGLLMKSSAYVKIADHILKGMVPFENYELTTQERGNTEGRLAVAVRDLGLKQIIVEPGRCQTHKICEQFHQPGYGTWYEKIGFRHTHGELNYAYRYKSAPPPAKYLDERYCGAEDIKAARIYDETKDIKSIEYWWAKD